MSHASGYAQDIVLELAIRPLTLEMPAITDRRKDAELLEVMLYHFLVLEAEEEEAELGVGDARALPF